MKKVLVLLAVCALALPTFAGEVTLSSENGVIKMTVVSGNPVGFALDVAPTTGAIGDDVVVDSFFDIFIDLAYDMETATPGSYTYGAGTNPVCFIDMPGATTPSAAAAEGDGSFAVCAGGLGGSEKPLTAGPGAGDTVDLVTLACAEGSENVTATVTLNAKRGGIVDKDGTAMVVNGLPLTVTIVCSTDPECWGYQFFAKGDSNGDGALTYTGDVQPLIDAWNSGIYDPCVDFNKDGALTYTGDVQVLIDNWGKPLE
jgi:hypothetical protein